MAVAAAVLAALCISLIIFHLHNLQDSSRGEPVRAEEARVHAKENCHSRAGSSYYLYFHVPCRDTVVTCQVPPDIWYYLSKGDRGTLCHQGGPGGGAASAVADTRLVTLRSCCYFPVFWV